MAEALYHETRGETDLGVLAVGRVILNRVEDPRFPNSICGVVHNRSSSACSFSYYCDGVSDRVPNTENGLRIKALANDLVNGQVPAFLDGATHYHTTRIRPYWVSQKEYITEIENHIFYRWN